AHEPHRKAIVFTNTKATADRLGGVLRSTAHKVFVLHGDKDTKDRKLALERLNSGAVTVLVATDVAARGLDVDGLELVINFDMPRSGDDYLHRIGRTGRGDGEGAAISLVESFEWNLMASIQRYLRQEFEFRVVEALRGRYLGPKERKRSGKAVGSKHKKLKKKALAQSAKAAGKKPAAKKKAARKRPAPSPAPDTQGGFAKPKRRKNPGPLD
ncbi:MAG TPA: RNA helicase, partial [Alcanivorax sp.]|nr:RNA helicase [Alcanivorax sp.]HBT06872.1 RNA helicase [Alcanivorax sp.]HCD75303.1 RNA helicase [Alcanivorax sp.]